MAVEINPATAKAATEENKLDLSKLRLLGVVSKQDKAEALLLAPDGRTLKVRSGQQTPFGQIKAVGESFVIIDTGVFSRRLSLPS